MRSLANLLIVAVCTLALVAGVAHDLGVKAERQRLATTCPATQAGERLVSTHQLQDGTLWCSYSTESRYGRGPATKRRAT